MKIVDKVNFGRLTFDKAMMKKALPKPIYLKWKQAVRNMESLEKETADIIAQAMKNWAIENGATHYCHWFQPLNGRTAKKIESFIDRSKENDPIENFSGDELIKSESDASSFPNGGIRSTFEARGYNYWDLTSNAFILDKVMYIPSIFVSYTGDTLDKKLPLSKSIDYLSESVTKVVNKVSRHKAYRTKVKLGLEQEFFLIPKEMYEKRADLVASGRTIFGYPRIKSQEQGGHYFGLIPAKVKAFYDEVNLRLWELGIYAKTEHNEVAPTQFEIACLFSDVNIAIDQNHIVMEILKSVAQKHGLVCLLHEKPYKKLNGSGKHNNYSIVTNEGLNLFDPEKDKMLFVIATLCLMEATKKYPTLLRVSSSNVRNDFRLGGSEAPPAIISIFLGNAVEKLIYGFAGLERKAYGKESNIVINRLNYTPADDSDRNRTSPFAFTGNKFEFRMLGSSLSASDLNIALNTIIGASFEDFYKKIKDFEGEELENKIKEIIKQMLEENQDILFGGDNYLDAWKEEAKRRGLPNYETYLDALFYWKKENNIFVDKKIFTREELDAQENVLLEDTSSYYEIEAHAMLYILQKNIEPSVMEEMIRHGKTLSYVKNANIEEQLELLNNLLDKAFELKSTILSDLKKAEILEGFDKAFFYRERVGNSVCQLAGIFESFEEIIGQDLWKLPNYEDIFNSLN